MPIYIVREDKTLLKRADGLLNKMLDWIDWCVLYTSALCHLYHSMLIAKYTVYYPLSTIFWDDSALPL